MKTLCCTIAMLLGVFMSQTVLALEESELSITPLAACKRSAAPAPKWPQDWRKDLPEGITIGEIIYTGDLNGDGWCDLVYEGYLTQRGPDPEARDLIWLGSEKGWGNWYVKPENWHGQWDRKKGDWIIRPRLTVPERMKFIMPDDNIGMDTPLLAYPKAGGPPYFMGVYKYPERSSFSSYDDFVVYRWDKEFNMPREVSDAELVVVLRFWRRHYCTGRYTDENFRYIGPPIFGICSPAAQEAIDKAQERLAAEPKSP